MRSYRDLCGIARALDVVGERWALLVVRELLFGPKRFADLHRGLPGLSQNVLTQRLRELEASGVLARRRALPPAAGLIYELTDRGRTLEPVLLALGRWGSPLSPQPDSAEELSPDALIVALRTTFDAAAMGSLRGTVKAPAAGRRLPSHGQPRRTGCDPRRRTRRCRPDRHRAHRAGPRVRPARARRRHPERSRERRGRPAAAAPITGRLRRPPRTHGGRGATPQERVGAATRSPGRRCRPGAAWSLRGRPPVTVGSARRRLARPEPPSRRATATPGRSW